MISVVCILIFQYIIHPREKIILNILFVILQQTGFDGPMPKINTSHYITLKKKLLDVNSNQQQRRRHIFFCNNYEKRSVFHFINELITRERKRNTHRKKNYKILQTNAKETFCFLRISNMATYFFDLLILPSFAVFVVYSFVYILFRGPKNTTQKQITPNFMQFNFILVIIFQNFRHVISYSEKGLDAWLLVLFAASHCTTIMVANQTNNFKCILFFI